MKKRNGGFSRNVRSYIGLSSVLAHAYVKEVADIHEISIWFSRSRGFFEV